MEDLYKKRMEDSTKLLEKQKDILDDCIVKINDTEDIAQNSLQNLIGQREKIINVTNKVDDINNDLHIANKNIKKMQWSNVKNKLIIIFIIMIIFVIIVGIIILGNYLYDKKKS